ncbi:MAG: OmpH family outer membrane protein [Thermoguttaceae bacterium]|nr:OmpH family outer membrane protein [Thermoguttaceae bacterium]
MKNVRTLTRSLLCASLCLVCGLAEAQQPAARQAAPRAAAQATAQPARQTALLVGVIDMRSVLERHPGVADKMPELVKKLQAEEAKLMQARQSADKEIAGIQAEFEVGSQEYTDRTRAAREKFTAAGFEAQEAQEAIVAERTKILYQAYTDVQDAIKTVAQQYGILIVHSKIKFDAAGKVPEEVVALQEADQNPIVWNRPECDITDAVIKQLASKVGEPQTKAAPAQTALSNVGQQAMQAAAAPVAPRAAAPNATRAASAPTAAPRR